MKAILASSLLVFSAATAAIASERTMYSSGDGLNVRLCAGAECCVAERLKRDAPVTVFEVTDGWARISVFHDAATSDRDCKKPAADQMAHWVSFDYLTATMPDGSNPNAWSGFLSDRRIRGVPKVGDYGLERGELEIIRRYASQLLLQGTCEAIEAGNKSVSRVGTYYVLCKGESEQRYFSAADLES